MIRYILIFPPPRRYPVFFFVLPHKISFFLKKFTGMAVLTTCLFFGGGKPFGCWDQTSTLSCPPSPHRARWCKHLISGTGSSHNTKWPSQVENLGENWKFWGQNFRKKWGVDGCNSSPTQKNGWKLGWKMCFQFVAFSMVDFWRW